LPVSFLDSRTRAARQGFGKPVLRREDARLLVGRGCFSDDFSLLGQVYAHLVRSPHAHARIRDVNVVEALSVPGVLAVLTGVEAVADGLQPIPHRPVPSNPHEVPLRSRDGTEPALGAVVNAIVDALWELGVEHIEMPATPERVWRAIHAGRPPSPR